MSSRGGKKAASGNIKGSANPKAKAATHAPAHAPAHGKQHEKHAHEKQAAAVAAVVVDNKIDAKVMAEMVVTVAGHAGAPESKDGTALTARFVSPFGIAPAQFQLPKPKPAPQPIAAAVTAAAPVISKAPPGGMAVGMSSDVNPIIAAAAAKSALMDLTTTGPLTQLLIGDASGVRLWDMKKDSITTRRHATQEDESNLRHGQSSGLPNALCPAMDWNIRTDLEDDKSAPTAATAAAAASEKKKAPAAGAEPQSPAVYVATSGAKVLRITNGLKPSHAPKKIANPRCEDNHVMKLYENGALPANYNPRRPDGYPSGFNCNIEDCRQHYQFTNLLSFYHCDPCEQYDMCLDCAFERANPGGDVKQQREDEEVAFVAGQASSSFESFMRSPIKQASGLEITRDGDFAYVSCQSSNSILCIDLRFSDEEDMKQMERTKIATGAECWVPTGRELIRPVVLATEEPVNGDGGEGEDDDDDEPMPDDRWKHVRVPVSKFHEPCAIALDRYTGMIPDSVLWIGCVKAQSVWRYEHLFPATVVKYGFGQHPDGLGGSDIMHSSWLLPELFRIVAEYASGGVLIEVPLQVKAYSKEANAGFKFTPGGMSATNGGYLIMSCTHNHALFAVNMTTGETEVIAGALNGMAGYNTVPVQPDKAWFNEPRGVVVDQVAHCAYVVDSKNLVVRRVPIPKRLFLE